MKNIATFSIFIIFITTLCYGQNSYEYSQPKTLDDGWKTNNLKSLKVDTARIYQLFDQIKNGKNKVHSVLLIKDDQLIIEEYFNEHSTDKLHDLRSATKSIRSILMGIAIDKGFVDKVDDPILKYLKSPIPTKNFDERKEKITIEHLLTMSTRLDCNDWDRNSKGQEDKVYRKDDWLQYTLDLPMVNEPGTVSNYCSMNAVLLFAEQYLFSPLGITTANPTIKLENSVAILQHYCFRLLRDNDL